MNVVLWIEMQDRAEQLGYGSCRYNCTFSLSVCVCQWVNNVPADREKRDCASFVSLEEYSYLWLAVQVLELARLGQW